MNSINRTRGAVPYTRVSTGEQDKHGTSPETQRDACRQKALELSLPVIAEYHDGGISGGFLLSRTGFQAAIKDIREGRANTLICPSISRYSRDVEHQQAVKKAVKAAGGQLVFCDLNFTIQGGFAEYEKAVIRKRTMAGKRKRAEEGRQPVRATSPYGYRIVTKADVLRGEYPADQIGQYQIVEPQAEVAREMFTRYAAGQSLNTLARWLNGGENMNGGEKTSEGATANAVPTGGKAAFWRPTGIRYILQNPAYRGEAHFRRRTYRKEESRLQGINPYTGKPYKQDIVRRPAPPENVVSQPCPPLVSAELWEMVNALLPGNQKSGGRPGLVRMLSGLAFCPHCGGSVVSGAGGRNSYKSVSGEVLYYPKERRYHCAASFRQKHTTGAHTCTGETYMIRRIEEATVQAILAVAGKPKAVGDALLAFRAAEEIKERNTAMEAASQGAGPAELPVPDALRREKAALDAALTEIAADDLLAVQAQMSGMKAGASPEAYAAVFTELTSRRKDLEDRHGVVAWQLKAMEARSEVVAKAVEVKAAPKPKPAEAADVAARALAVAYDVLTADAVPNAK